VSPRVNSTGEIIEFNGIAADELVDAVPEEVQQGHNSAIIRAGKYLRGIAN
jgi:hypothetical protein